MSNLCDDSHTVDFTNRKLVFEKDNSAVEAGKLVDRVYSIDIQRVIDTTMATLDATWDVLSVWHARLAHADQNAIKEIARSDAVQGSDMTKLRPTNSCLPCVEKGSDEHSHAFSNHSGSDARCGAAHQCCRNECFIDSLG